MIRERRFITAQQNAENINFSADISIKHTILREPSMVDEFYLEPSKPSDDAMESVSYIDPIYMMFNQDRIENMGQFGSKQFIESFIQKNDSLQELRSKMSDDELISMIKSRHLQSPAEITAWCRYIESNIDNLKAEHQAYLDAQKQAASGQAASGQAASGQAASGQAASGQAASGQAASGESAEVTTQ